MERVSCSCCIAHAEENELAPIRKQFLRGAPKPLPVVVAPKRQAQHSFKALTTFVGVNMKSLNILFYENDSFIPKGKGTILDIMTLLTFGRKPRVLGEAPNHP